VAVRASGGDRGIEEAPVKLSCVILTMGTRPAEFERAVRSVEALHGDRVDLVIVGNGADLPPVPAGVKTIRLPENVGVPGGRNIAVDACTGDVILFLDDDAWYHDPGIGEYVAGRFAADPKLAVLAFRVVDPAGGSSGRWHVPRLRAGDPGRSSPVTTFGGGMCAIRRSAYLEAGGLPDDFFFAHEEIDLSWRLIDLGYRLEYDAAAEMSHPHVPNSRHPTWYRQDGRNRVLLARRNLPWPLAWAYVLEWMAMTLLRERSPAAIRAWLSGFAEGWRTAPGPRRPISASAIWRMTRAGRPPVI
jgi:GT2 family glycosyltransferase